jgi:hypothetical protein
VSHTEVTSYFRVNSSFDLSASLIKLISMCILEHLPQLDGDNPRMPRVVLALQPSTLVKAPAGKRCSDSDRTKMPQWRASLIGPDTLCANCGSHHWYVKKQWGRCHSRHSNKTTILISQSPLQLSKKLAARWPARKHVILARSEPDMARPSLGLGWPGMVPQAGLGPPPC